MALIKCPDCGKQISDRAPKCIHCGCPSRKFNVPKTISCPECGGSIDLNKEKCPNCGFPIEKVNKAQEENNRDSVLENEIIDEEKEFFCTNCGTPVTGVESFCPNCGCQFVYDKVDNSSYSTPWHWWYNWQRVFQVSFAFLSMVYVILMIAGATGDIHVFARKYALKYGYDYSDVNRKISESFNVFPYPHSDFYFRLKDGSKITVGSCAFWIYSIEDVEDLSVESDTKNITKETLMEAILKKGSFNSNLGPVYPTSNWTVVSGGEYVGDINIIEMKEREATIDIVLHYTGMYIGKLTYRLNSDGSWDNISETYGNSN